MKTKTLHQSVLLKATPHEVYEALLDSKKHTEFTHSPAVIRREVGAEFSAFDFTQADIPEDLYSDLKAGWVEYYWDNLTAYFG